MKSTFSLLVPVFNGQKFIESIDNSIRALEIPFDEIIFYDDGSTDNSGERLRELGYKVIRSDDNNGPSKARNVLIKQASSEWLHFHDIDDFIFPCYLEQTGKLISKEVDAIICDADWIGEKTGELIIRWQYRKDQFIQSGPAYLLKNPVGGINGLYRKSALVEIGGFDESLKVWEDADLNLRLTINNKKIVFTESVLVSAIRHEQSTSADPHKIRLYKFAFLKKYLAVKDESFRLQLIMQANSLFHEIVYNKDWKLYNDITALFKELKVLPPLTKGYLSKYVKWILGPRRFTLLKWQYLKLFYRFKAGDR